MIAGSVGEYAIFARQDRNSPDWYVGGVNDGTARELTLHFDFLDAGKTYHATIYRDAAGISYLDDSRHRIAYDSRDVEKGDTLTLWLAPGGGAAMRIAAPRR